MDTTKDGKVNANDVLILLQRMAAPIPTKKTTKNKSKSAKSVPKAILAQEDDQSANKIRVALDAEDKLTLNVKTFDQEVASMNSSLDGNALKTTKQGQSDSFVARIFKSMGDHPTYKLKNFVAHAQNIKDGSSKRAIALFKLIDKKGLGKISRL